MTMNVWHQQRMGASPPLSLCLLPLASSPSPFPHHHHHYHPAAAQTDRARRHAGQRASCSMGDSKYPEVNTCIASFRYQSACLPDSRAISNGHAHLGDMPHATTRPPCRPATHSPIFVCLLTLWSLWKSYNFLAPNWVAALTPLCLPVCWKLTLKDFRWHEIAWHRICGSMGSISSFHQVIAVNASPDMLNAVWAGRTVRMIDLIWQQWPKRAEFDG